MRAITVKYQGSCSKCGAQLAVGTSAMYEKTTGIFCVGCEPTDPDDIRRFRQDKAERKAERLERWAEKRETEAKAQLDSFQEVRSDWAFITQPGHIPLREKINRGDAKAFENLKVAKRMREKAQNIRNVRVAGDAERKREAARSAIDEVAFKGARVYDACFGSGTIVSIHAKSFRIKFGDSGPIFAIDKSYFANQIESIKQQREKAN